MWDKHEIKDAVTGLSYDAKSECPFCGKDEIKMLHTINSDYPNDISKDWVVCRCEECRMIFWKPDDAYEKIYAFEDKWFTNPLDAVAKFNKVAGY